MDFLAAIIWDLDPEIVTILGRPIRWYGPLFASGFFFGIYIAQAMFKKEGIPEDWLEKGFLFMLGGTILGARLGHVLFYDWPYYSQHLWEIPMIWQGGLASHGALLGITLALYLYSRYVTKRSIIWISDRVVVPVALGAALIRLGNFTNSEIVGKLADPELPWSVIFALRTDLENPPLPRHPVQLYEAFAYLLIFAFLMFLYWRTQARNRRGELVGWFMTLVFSARFIMEYFKTSQGGFESSLASVAELSTGQWLSIPCVLLGMGFLYFAYTKGVNPWPPVEVKVKKENRAERKRKARKKS